MQIALQSWWTGQEGSIRSKRDTDEGGFGQAKLVIDSGWGVGGVVMPAGTTDTETNSIFHQILCTQAICMIGLFKVKLENQQ